MQTETCLNSLANMGVTMHATVSHMPYLILSACLYLILCNYSRVYTIFHPIIPLPYSVAGCLES